MKKILIVYSCSNGYSCSCCGQWWDEVEVYEVDDSVDVKEFVREKDKEVELNDYGREAVDSAYVVGEEINYWNVD